MLRKGSFWIGLLAAVLILAALGGAGYAVFRWGYAYGAAQSANWQPPSAEDLQQWRQQWREDGDGRPLPFMMRRSYGMMPFGTRRFSGVMPFGMRSFSGMMQPFGGFSLMGGLLGFLLVLLLAFLVIAAGRFAFRPWNHEHRPPPWANQPPQGGQTQPASGDSQPTV